MLVWLVSSLHHYFPAPRAAMASQRNTFAQTNERSSRCSTLTRGFSECIYIVKEGYLLNFANKLSALHILVYGFSPLEYTNSVQMSILVSLAN